MTVESQRRFGERGIPAMRMLRDARINLVWEGTSEILRVWMAREALAPYIDHGVKFLQGGLSEKIAAPFFYGRMALHSSLLSFSSGRASAAFGKDYMPWIRLIETSARRLTRSTLAATLRHRQTLHHKQLLLQDLVDDSLAIFPMAATIWYASQPDMRTMPGIQDMVNYFCEDAAGRLSPDSSLKRSIRRHKRDATVHRLATRITRGDYAWLEKGIMPLLDK